MKKVLSLFLVCCLIIPIFIIKPNATLTTCSNNSDYLLNTLEQPGLITTGEVKKLSRCSMNANENFIDGWFIFDMTNKGYVEISLKDLNNETFEVIDQLNTTVNVYDSNNNMVLDYTYQYSYKDSIKLKVGIDVGRYKIKVSTKKTNEVNSYDFNLSINSFASNSYETENNNSIPLSNQINFNEKIYGTTHRSVTSGFSDNDMYKFNSDSNTFYKRLLIKKNNYYPRAQIYHQINSSKLNEEYAFTKLNDTTIFYDFRPIKGTNYINLYQESITYLKSEDYTLELIDANLSDTFKINEVNENTTQINGNALKNSTIQVYNGAQLLAQSDANYNGEFSLYIPKQASGTTLTIINSEYGYPSYTFNIEVVDLESLGNYFYLNDHIISDSQKEIGGRSKPTSRIELYINDQLKTQSICDSSGSFNLSDFGSLKSGDRIKIINKLDGYQEYSKEFIVMKSLDTSTVINTLYKYEKYIQGKTLPNTTIKVYNDKKELIGTSTSKPDGSFSIGAIAYNQFYWVDITFEKEDYKMYRTIVRAVENLENDFQLSFETIYEYRRIPYIKATGKKTYGSVINVYNSNNEIILSNNNFSSDLGFYLQLNKEVMKYGNQFKVENTNYSSPNVYKTITVDIDLQKYFTLNYLTENGELAGQALDGSTIKIYINNKLTQTIEVNGWEYSIQLPALKPNDVVKVENSYNGAKTVFLEEVVRQKDLDTITTCKPINIYSNYIKCKTAPNTYVSVYELGANSTSITGYSNDVGEVKIYLFNTDLYVGKPLIFKLNNDKYYSKEKLFYVENDEYLNQIKINYIDENTQYITGNTPLEGSVKLGWKNYSHIFSNIDRNGNFSLRKYDGVKAGDTVSICLTNIAGYREKCHDRIVYPVWNNSLTVEQPILSNKYIKGKTDPNSLVYLLDKNNIQISTAQSNSIGEFTLFINGIALGDNFKIVNEKYDPNNKVNISREKILTMKDSLANSLIVNNINNNDTKIVGKAISGSTIKVNNGQNTIGQGQVDNFGNFSISIPKQSSNSILTIVNSKINYLDHSKKINVLKSHDTFRINELNNNSSLVTGIGSIGSTINLYVGTTRIGSGLVGKNGAFSITIPKQKSGTKITAKISLSGYQDKVIIVNTLAYQSGFTVNNVNVSSRSINGKGSSGSKVEAFVGTKKIGQTIVSSNGNFNINIPVQRFGTKITIKITKNGYSTTTKTINTLYYHSNFSVNDINTSSKSIIGKATPGSKVEAYVGSKRIGSAVVSSKGTYKINIPRQKRNTNVNVKIIKPNYENRTKSIKV